MAARVAVSSVIPVSLRSGGNLQRNSVSRNLRDAGQHLLAFMSQRTRCLMSQVSSRVTTIMNLKKQRINWNILGEFPIHNTGLNGKVNFLDVVRPHFPTATCQRTASAHDNPDPHPPPTGPGLYACLPLPPALYRFVIYRVRFAARYKSTVCMERKKKLVTLFLDYVRNRDEH